MERPNARSQRESRTKYGLARRVGTIRSALGRWCDTRRAIGKVNSNPALEREIHFCATMRASLAVLAAVIACKQCLVAAAPVKAVTALTGDNWDTITNSDKAWLLEFYAPW